MQNIRNFNLLKLVPPSLQGDSQVQAACQALEGELQAVSVAIDQIMIISKLDQQPSEVIDSLAWQRHVDFYDDTLPLKTRMELVKNAIPWHRRKGTPSAVEEVISAAINPAQVIEWFDYGGHPYHFKIQTQGTMTSQTAYDQLKKAINTVKNTRSWLDEIQIQTTVNIGEPGKKSLYFGFITDKGGKQTIGLTYPTRATLLWRWGAANRTGGHKKINISLPTKAPVNLYTGAFLRRGGKITIGRRQLNESI